MSSSNFPANLFKGRIGEAIVEAVLIEFGYDVQRAGYEQVSAGDNPLQPDLLVSRKDSPGYQRFVEVKYRAGRPTHVRVEPEKLQIMGKQFPGTIIAYVSPYDAGVYCATVEELSANQTPSVNLFDAMWRPLSEFFPEVRRGERLKELSEQLQATMQGYGTWTIPGRTDERLWEGEYQALAKYIDEAWDPELEQLGVFEEDIESLTLEERWNRVREIAAAHLATDLFEEEAIPTQTLMLVMQRALGKRGEAETSIDLEKLAAALGVDLEQAGIFSQMITGAIVEGRTGQNTSALDTLLKTLPDGFGEVVMMDPALPFDQSEKIDLKTMIKLVVNPCRLDI